MHNFFEVLGLDPNKSYSKEEIKKQWRSLCNIHHPDKGGVASEFNKITHAYKMLTDPSYRADQDKHNINLNINFQVPVDFEDAFFGKNITISFNKFEVDDNSKLIINKEQDLFVMIIPYPAGQMGGYSKTIPGGGLKNKDKNGDANIVFVVKQHPRYQIDGNGNIFTQEKLDLETMLRGGTIEVQTLYGIHTCKVPPGTRPGDRLIIKGCGLLQRGSHIVDPQPIYPTKQELKSKSKFNNLKINWQDFQEEQEHQNNSPQGIYLGVDMFTRGS